MCGAAHHWSPWASWSAGELPPWRLSMARRQGEPPTTHVHSERHGHGGYDPYRHKIEDEVFTESPLIRNFYNLIILNLIRFIQVALFS
jgi:hypothetical protein